MSPTLRVQAPAKLNLELRILAREVSGYHQLESLFLGISLADHLDVRITDGGEVDLAVEGDTGGAVGADNLVYRAARAFLDRWGRGAGVALRLEKIVPVAAGLGGGSSDSAAVLRGLDALLPGRAPSREVLALAAELGSDVPFFLGSTPAAWAWGRGGRFLSLDPPPSRPLLLALPERGVSTREAYAGLGDVATRRAVEPARYRVDELTSWTALAARRVNDFESALYPERPDLRALAEMLMDTRPELTGMTGSGAAHFAVYRSAEARAEARQRLETADPEVRILEARTLERWPESTRGSG